MAGMVTVTGIDGPDGLERLVADLTHEAKVAPAEARKVVQKGCLNIKQDWRKRWSGFPHAPRLPYTIGYDTKQLGGRIDGEVGPDKDKPQGALGNLLEYGSKNNPPHPHIRPAADEEEPKFVAAMEDLAVKALGL